MQVDAVGVSLIRRLTAAPRKLQRLGPYEVGPV